ncbi:MAG TPA: HD domain-containing protein [Candidatus Limnocylindria bacterium]|nr:HD domain-containing protein [Candidatus Limnocylindria bacterium]
MKLIHADSKELEAKLQAYLDADAKYKAAYDYTKRRFDEATHLTAHNWAHCYRDTLNAIVIGEAEGADMSIALPATTMHDIGFLYGATGKTHGALGADKLAEYLGEGGIEYPEDMIQKMADCLRTHKGSMHNEKPETLEAKVVADADLVEKFGPIGVYQYIRTFTEFNYSLEIILERGASMKTLSLETETGKRLAEPGRQFVMDFFTQLREAVEPYGTDGQAEHGR